MNELRVKAICVPYERSLINRLMKEGIGMGIHILKMSGFWLKQGANMGNMERMASLFVFPPIRLE